MNPKPVSEVAEPTARREPLSRAARRCLVIGAYGGYLAVVVFWSLSSRFGAPRLLFLALLAGLVTLYSYGRLLYTGGFWKLANAPDDMLDERQIRARDAAYRGAYALVATAVLLPLVYWYIAADADKFVLWLPRTFGERNAVFWGAWLFLTTLPAAVLVWLEPDPAPSEDTPYEGAPSERTMPS